MTQFSYIYNKLDQNETKQYDCNETRSLRFDFPRDSTTLHATTKMANWQNFAEILGLNSFQKKTTSFSNIQLKLTLCAKNEKQEAFISSFLNSSYFYARCEIFPFGIISLISNEINILRHWFLRSSFRGLSRFSSQKAVP